MPHSKIATKWRPSLAMIVAGVLVLVAILPIAVLLSLRIVTQSEAAIGWFEISVLLGSLLVVVIVARVFSRAITGPIEHLVARAEEIAEGGRSAIRPLDRYGTRELAHLSQSLMALATKLVDRTEYVQTLAAHASHELKSPITGIKGAAELLQEAEASGQEMTAAERSRFLGNIREDAERLEAQLFQLRQLASAELPGTIEPARLESIVSVLRDRFPGLEISITSDAMPETLIAENIAMIVLSHLANNASQHGASVLEISSSRIRDNLEILVQDNGSGITDGNAEQVFEPFFSTRKEEGGTGMGLPIAQALLAANAGAIELLPAEQGARFKITLPALADALIRNC